MASGTPLSPPRVLSILSPERHEHQHRSDGTMTAWWLRWTAPMCAGLQEGERRWDGRPVAAAKPWQRCRASRSVRNYWQAWRNYHGAAAGRVVVEGHVRVLVKPCVCSLFSLFTLPGICSEPSRVPVSFVAGRRSRSPGLLSIRPSPTDRPEVRSRDRRPTLVHRGRSLRGERLISVVKIQLGNLTQTL